MGPRTVWPQTLLRRHSLLLTSLAEADPQKTQPPQQPIKRKRSRLHPGAELGGAERGQHPPRIPPQQPHPNQSVERYQNNRKRPIPSGQDNSGRSTCKGKKKIHIYIIIYNGFSLLAVIFLMQFQVCVLIFLGLVFPLI